MAKPRKLRYYLKKLWTNFKVKQLNFIRILEKVTFRLTPWRWVLFAKLMVAQLLRKCLAFLWNRKIHITFTKAIWWSTC